MYVNRKELEPYIEKGLITCQKHPTGDLYIYNYTKKCQFDRIWDKVTTMCRGLIVRKDGYVVARPFDKFFNRGEIAGLEGKGKIIGSFDKLDGSLGIMYPLNGRLYIATRGSFVSEQAIEATNMLRKYLDSKVVKENLLNGSHYFTYLFEIIYPANRIVVDYGKDRKLVLLAMRSIDNGRILLPNKTAINFFEKPQEIDIATPPRTNAEGIVLYYEDGFMEKIKYEEYVRLHRLVTGITARRIWDIMRHNENMDELLDRVPEEFEQWVRDTRNGLLSDFERIEHFSERIYRFVENLETRKEQAIEIMKSDKKYAGIVFKMIDHEPYDQIIWKLLKPKAERPFREDM